MRFSSSQFSAAVLLDRALPESLLRTLKIFSGIFALGALAVDIQMGAQNVALGIFLVSASFFFTFSLLSQFVQSQKSNLPRILPLSLGSAEEETKRITLWRNYCDFESTAIVSRASALSVSSLGLQLLKSHFGRFFLERTGIQKEAFLTALSDTSSLDESRFAEALLREAIHAGHPAIRPSDILTVLTRASDPLKKLMSGANLQEKDYPALAQWYEIGKEHTRRRSFLETLIAAPGIGKTWAFSYTPLLDQFSKELNVAAGKEYLHIAAHKKEITFLEEALSKSENANAILVGEPGVGKTTIIKGLGKRIREGRSAAALNYKRLVLIDMNAVISEKNFGDLAGILTAILRQAESAGNVILAIDNIEQYLIPGSPVNVSEILLPFLKSSRINIIGTATRGGYEKSIAQNSLMRSLFEVVSVEEPGKEMMITILGDISLHHEKQYGVRVRYQALKKIYEYAASFSSDIPFPEAGLEALEEIFVASAKRGGSIGEEEVSSIFSEKRKAPIGVPEEKEKVMLLSLETELGKHIVDQRGALLALANALRRARAGVVSRNKPLGTFLFLGPTGVGKTETAKALARHYFGGENAMVRFDMSEYQNPEDTARLIGSEQGGIAGALSSAAHEHPFSLMLFDEIEKAHPNILNLFLQILDEGRLTDAFGKTASFKNAILIATSNAGAEFIRQELSHGRNNYESLQKDLVDFVLREGIFKPEFLNRFDGVIVFKPLSPEEVKEVARLMLGALGERLNEQGYEHEITEETLRTVAAKGYNETFGARELRRVIQDDVESRIAREILEEKYQKGDTIQI
ncbi:MAG: AAA family ATPase [bacterium]|nr:AAA family ATPase [bacterium]